MVQSNGESALALVDNQPIATMYEVCEQRENISLTGQEEEEVAGEILFSEGALLYSQFQTRRACFPIHSESNRAGGGGRRMI